MQIFGYGDRRMGILLGFLAVAIISTNPVAGRIAAYENGFLVITLALTLVSIAFAYVAGLLVSVKRPYFSRNLLALTVLTGGLKGLNDCLYYFAIGFGPTIETNIIAYLWPVFAILFGGRILEREWKVTQISSWILILTCFFGAIFVVIGSVADPTNASDPVFYLSAMVAAVVGGLYIVLYLRLCRDIEGTPVQKSIKVLVSTQTFNALFLLAAFAAFPSPITINTASVVSTLYLGIFIVVLFEMFWLVSVQLYKNLTFQSIAYFSPAISAVFLTALGLDKLTPLAILGVCAVIIGNTLLHISRAFSLSVTSFLFAIFLMVFVRSEIATTNIDTNFLEVTGLVFAIMIAFTIQRLHARNTSVFELISETQELSYKLLKRELADRLSKLSLSYLFARGGYDSDKAATQLSDEMKNKEVPPAISGNVFRMILIKEQGLYKGEIAVIAIISLALVYFLAIARSGSLLEEIILSLISASVIYVFFLIIELSWFSENLSLRTLASLQHGGLMRGGPIFIPATLEKRFAIPFPRFREEKVDSELTGEVSTLSPRDIHLKRLLSFMVVFALATSLFYIVTSECGSEAHRYCDVLTSMGISLPEAAQAL